MKGKNALLIFSISFLLITKVYGQEKQAFFPDKDLVRTGVYYYPEQWDKSQWNRDLGYMAKMGFEFTHMADFAWSLIEPEEGRYDFKWLDEAVAIAAKHGLKVIMCTPTAAPPAWLTKKYPEVLLVKENGIRSTHGGRQHFSWSSAKYRELIAKLVQAMAAHYGHNPNIYGWQIDNEPSHYGTIDYGPEVKKHFQQWLKKKYGDLEHFNKAWGNSFWSMRYDSFDDIFIPNKATNVQQVNPHALLDFQRFNASECADFVAFQSKILRKNILKTQWVTTNFMDFHSGNDAWLNDPDLDFISYTMYPVGGGYTNKGGVGDEGFRMGFPNKISFASDFSRYKKGFTAAMELQPGQVNWGLYNPQTFPGVVRAWLYSAYAGGSKLICSYRFKQVLFGGEMYHYGMMGTDGVTPTAGGKEFSQFIAEIAMLRKEYKKEDEMPASYRSKKTAILFNWDNYWDTEIQPQTNQWNPQEVLLKYHRALKRLGLPVDMISEDMDFSQYPFMVMPFYQLVDEKLLNKLKIYVEDGGHLVMTPRTGQKNKMGQLWEMPYGKIMEGLTGAKMVFYDVLPVENYGVITMGDATYKWNNWADVLEPLPGTIDWATYSSMFYRGKTAVSYRKLGKGSVTYVGPDTDNGALELEVLKKTYQTAGVNISVLPDGLSAEYRDGFWIAINYDSDKSLTVPIPEGSKILIGNKILKPADVAVWKEN
jgi:beta-galactosidase